MILSDLSFKTTTLIVAFRVDFRGQGWKKGDELECFIVIHVKDEGGLT